MSAQSSSLTEITRLLSKSGKFKPLVATAAFTDARLGELLGLRWQDIDYEEGFVRIRQQLGRDRLPAKLKTDRSRRDIVLIP